MCLPPASLCTRHIPCQVATVWPQGEESSSLELVWKCIPKGGLTARHPRPTWGHHLSFPLGTSAENRALDWVSKLGGGLRKSEEGKRRGMDVVPYPNSQKKSVEVLSSRWGSCHSIRAVLTSKRFLPVTIAEMQTEGFGVGSLGPQG